MPESSDFHTDAGVSFHIVLHYERELIGDLMLLVAKALTAVTFVGRDLGWMLGRWEYWSRSFFGSLFEGLEESA